MWFLKLPLLQHHHIGKGFRQSFARVKRGRKRRGMGSPRSRSSTRPQSQVTRRSEQQEGTRRYGTEVRAARILRSCGVGNHQSHLHVNLLLASRPAPQSQTDPTQPKAPASHQCGAPVRPQALPDLPVLLGSRKRYASEGSQSEQSEIGPILPESRSLSAYRMSHREPGPGWDPIWLWRSRCRPDSVKVMAVVGAANRTHSDILGLWFRLYETPRSPLRGRHAHGQGGEAGRRASVPPVTTEFGNLEFSIRRGE